MRLRNGAGHGIGNFEADGSRACSMKRGEAPDPPVEPLPSLKISLPGDMPRPQAARRRLPLAHSHGLGKRS